MKKRLLCLLPVLPLLIFTTSCSSDDDISADVKEEQEVNYPITLSFKEEGGKTLEQWKGGVKTDLNPLDINKYFINENTCLDYFNTETDVYSKSTEIVFIDDYNLNFKYNGNPYLLNYKFANDTLKVKLPNDVDFLDLGVGNKQQISIYSSLYKVEQESSKSCGGDEFLKYNFDGQFFMNKDERNALPFKNPSEMGSNDNVYFYNVEYILK